MWADGPDCELAAKMVWKAEQSQVRDRDAFIGVMEVRPMHRRDHGDLEEEGQGLHHPS